MGKIDILKRTLAALFFMASIGLVVFVIFVIGVERGVTEPKFEMVALFHKVGGLSVGAPVRLSGVTVGTVVDIDFIDQEVKGRGVKVVLGLFQKYQNQLRKSTRVAIITEGVLGEKIIEISTDPAFSRLDIRKPVIGVDPLDVQNLAEEFGNAAHSLAKASNSIDLMMDEMRLISISIKRILNRVEQRIIEGNLFKVF